MGCSFSQVDSPLSVFQYYLLSPSWWCDFEVWKDKIRKDKITPCHDLNECLGALNLEENECVLVKIVTDGGLEDWGLGSKNGMQGARVIEVSPADRVINSKRTICLKVNWMAEQSETWTPVHIGRWNKGGSIHTSVPSTVEHDITWSYIQSHPFIWRETSASHT